MLTTGLFARERGMQLATQMNKTPRFRIEGAVFGVLPVGVLDWFVPGDIPGLARHMFQVAARSNDAALRQMFQHRAASGWRLSLKYPVGISLDPRRCQEMLRCDIFHIRRAGRARCSESRHLCCRYDSLLLP